MGHEPPFPAPADFDPPAPLVVRAAGWVIFFSLVWLVVFCVVMGAAFAVSMLGGDIVTWLLGVPLGLAVAGAVTGVLGVIVTGWRYGGAR